MDIDLDKLDLDIDDAVLAEKIVDEENIIEFDVGNYYGSLSITEHDGKFFWSVENWDGYKWLEIPKSLFDTLKQYAEGKK